MVTGPLCQAHFELANSGHDILRDTLYTRIQLEWGKGSGRGPETTSYKEYSVGGGKMLNLENWDSKQSKCPPL